jgi:hypothetical protein
VVTGTSTWIDFSTFVLIADPPSSQEIRWTTRQPRYPRYGQVMHADEVEDVVAVRVVGSYRPGDVDRHR